MGEGRNKPALTVCVHVCVCPCVCRCWDIFSFDNKCLGMQTHLVNNDGEHHRKIEAEDESHEIKKEGSRGHSARCEDRLWHMLRW